MAAAIGLRCGAVGAGNALHLDQQGYGQPLSALGYRKLSARPRHHVENPAALTAFKKFPQRVAEIAARDAPGKPIEIWFQDEARIGQKNKITRRWAKRGARPSAPHDQRAASTFIFGAI